MRISVGPQFSVPVITWGDLIDCILWVSWESWRNHGAYSSLPSPLQGGCPPAHLEGGRGRIPSPDCEGHLYSEQDHASAMFVPSMVSLNVVSKRTHPWGALDQTPRVGWPDRWNLQGSERQQTCLPCGPMCVTCEAGGLQDPSVPRTIPCWFLLVMSDWEGWDSCPGMKGVHCLGRDREQEGQGQNMQKVTPKLGNCCGLGSTGGEFTCLVPGAQKRL